jgi:putative transposase
MRRSDLPDGHFHLTAAGAGGTHIYVDDLDRLEFLHALGIATTRFGWRLAAYCLMGTHYHLLVETEANHLAPAMQWLNGVYARRVQQAPPAARPPLRRALRRARDP